VLYELVTGRRPFDCASAFALMMAHVEEAPVPPIELEPSLPPLLNQAILRSLAKDPSERFLTADDYRRTLMQVKASRTQVKPSRVALPSLPAFQRSWLAGAAAAFAVLTVGVAGFVRSHGGHRIHQPPAAAVVIQPEVQAQKPPIPASPAPQPVPAEPRQANNSPQRAPVKIAAAKRAAAKPAATSAVVRESALEPTPAISNTMIQPPEERPATQADEPQPPVQHEVEAAIQPAAPPPQAPADTYTEATPKPGANGLKKGLGKFWQIMRHKKSSSEDSASSTETGRQ
jgi:eukaryotic-like serine/threonine-protein kinase